MRIARPPIDRLLPKLAASGDCLVWTGCKSPKGYGQINANGRRLLTHRVAFEAAKGPIPSGMHLDHLCRNPSCCKPEHLEAVTPGENTRRGLAGHHNKAKAERSHCPHGHEYAAGNEYITPKGARDCRACRTDAGRRARERRRNQL